MPERNQPRIFFLFLFAPTGNSVFLWRSSKFWQKLMMQKKKKNFLKVNRFCAKWKKTFVGQNFAKINKWHWSSFFSGTQSRGAFWNDNQMLFKLERFCHRVCLFKPDIVPAALLKGLLLFLSKSAKMFWQLLYFSSTTFYPRSDKHYGRGGLDPGSSCSTSNSSSH